MDWGSEKGEKLKEATEAALYSGAHHGAQSRKGKNQVVAAVPSAGRSKEIQWAFLQEWAV